MNAFLKKIMNLISYQENTDREIFFLRENDYDRKAAMQATQKESSNKTETNDSEKKLKAESSSSVDNGEKPRGTRRTPRKLKQSGVLKKESRKGKADSSAETDSKANAGKVCTRLAQNRAIVEQFYGLPENKDLVLREFTIGADPTQEALIIYFDGMVDRATLNSLLQDLMVFTREYSHHKETPAEYIMKNLLPGSQIKVLASFEEIFEAVNYGDSAFFFEGSDSAVVVETKGWDKRSVERPNNEQTITGPQESFVENLRSNTALIRKIIRSEKLYSDIFAVGTRIRSDLAVMYIKDLANPELVAEVKRRVSSIKTDFIIDTGMLEQLIEDHPYNLNAQALSTERPDRVAAALAEGRVAILLSGSPFVLVVPVTMYEALHTGEENYLRWQYGSFIRYVRTLSFYMALLLPGAYLAIVLYHQEMIPTELLLAIAGNRERVPFPTVVEMLLMEFAFELVREAGLRIPGIIGSTIGIVGALILGQAAVEANIVSPILVILVAATGLASFSIPSYSLAFTVRIYRFMYIFLGTMLGFYGITIGLFIQILLTVNLTSFGVPYLSPSGPRTHAGQDIVYRLPSFLDRRRPDYLNTQDDTRNPREPRGWVQKGSDDHAGKE